MIKTSKHTIRFANKTKQTNLKLFLEEYRRVAAVILDYLWNNKNTFNNKVLDIANKKYNCPLFISTTNLNIQTTLSARALKCCSTQVCSMIRSALEKPKHRQYRLGKLKEQNKPTKLLQKVINNQEIIKPNVTNIKAELNSICCDYKPSNNNFNGFLQLKSIGKSFGKIRIPIKNHRHSNKLSKGQLLNSFLISNKSIDFRWQLSTPKIKTNGTVLGADQGYKDVLTLSNGIVTQKQDQHGHSLESITKKLARKRKGSKAFNKAQIHRTNFIHWSINQLNFNNIKELRLEKIVNIGYRKRKSRLMSHWCNTIIRDKLKSKCEEEEVLLTLQPSAYRSQRCYACGWVCKSNRNGKQFKCKSCGHQADADLNAAKNLTLNLPIITFDLLNKKLNRKGFYWKSNGLFFGSGVYSPTSPEMK